MDDDVENQNNQTFIKGKDKLEHYLSEKLTKNVKDKDNKNNKDTYKYISIPESKRKKKCDEVRFFKLPNIIISSLISLSFYCLLITLLIKSERTSLILFIIVFLVGHFAQSQVIPEFPSFKSEEAFYKKLQDILDSSVSIKSENKINHAYYIYDVINELYIPKKIKIIKFGELILYTDKTLEKEINKVNKNFSLKNRKIRQILIILMKYIV